MISNKSFILIISNKEDEISTYKRVLGPYYNLDIMNSSTNASTHIHNNNIKYISVIISADMPVLNGFSFLLKH